MRRSSNDIDITITERLRDSPSLSLSYYAPSSLLLLAAPAHLFFLLPPVLSPFFSTVVLPGPLPCAEDSPPSCIVRFLSTSFLSGKQPPSAAAAPERKLVKRNLMMHDGGVPSAQILPGSHSARAVEVPLRG